MSDLALFDLTEPDPEQDDWIELRADDGAPCSCRYCHTATTARGILNRGHGADSDTCARMLAWQEQE